MIVLDASTAILLAKAELLDRFVEAVRQPVVIPREIERECQGRPESLDAQLITRAIKEKRIMVRTIGQTKHYETIRREFPLGRGEVAAIALALESGNSLVATDDRQAINACKILRIPFTTALSVLMRMWEKGLLSRDEALGKLAALGHHGRYKGSTIDEARLEIEEKRAWRKQ